MIVELNIPKFRLLFPKFRNTEIFPDVVIEQQWQIAILRCSPEVGKSPRTYEFLDILLNYLLCHNLTVWASNNGIAGFPPLEIGITQSATVGSVSVGKQAVPIGNISKMELYSTECGRQYLALLQSKNMAGIATEDNRITCINPILPLSRG